MAFFPRVQFLLSILGCLSLVALVISVGFLNRRQGLVNLNRVKFSEPLSTSNDYNFTISQNQPPTCSLIAKTSITPCPDILLLRINVSAIDPVANAFTMRVQYFPLGTMSLGNFENGKGIASRDISVAFGTNRNVVKEHPANQVMATSEVTLPLVEGDLNLYPLDFFSSSQFSITADGVPMLVAMTAAIQSWTISIPTLVDISNTRDGSSIVVKVDFIRSLTTRFFSIFVFILMWILSVLMFALAVSIFVRKRKVEPPTLAIAVTLLFALPAIRNSQALVPPIGSTIDTVGFFWNITLSAFAAGLLVLNYILEYNLKAPPKRKKQS